MNISSPTSFPSKSFPILTNTRHPNNNTVLFQGKESSSQDNPKAAMSSKLIGLTVARILLLPIFIVGAYLGGAKWAEYDLKERETAPAKTQQEALKKMTT